MPDAKPPSAGEYFERLVRAVLVTESAFAEEGKLAEFGQVELVLRDRIYPMILEWSALPFLPTPELLVLADRFMVPAGERTRVHDERSVELGPLFEFFSSRLLDREGRPLSESLGQEMEGASHPSVRQAIRARALAVISPTPSLPGSYEGSIADVRAKLKDPGEMRELYYRHSRRLSPPTERPLGLLGGLDVDWLADQARTWGTKEFRDFLSGRLRPKRMREESLRAKTTGAVEGLIGTLRALVDKHTPKLDTLENLCEAIRSRPFGDLAEALLRRVFPMVVLDDPPWANQDLPVGGYSDVSTRGTFDRLLLSNLVYPEEEFSRRLAEGELLYYELEAPPLQAPPRQYVFLDASPSTWGIPRLAGAAVALSVAQRARERRSEASIFAAGRVDRPFRDLDRSVGMHALLDYQRWEEEWARDLEILGKRIKEEIAKHPSGADLFICTEGARLGDLGRWAAEGGLPERVRLLVFAPNLEDGVATLFRRDGGAFVAVAKSSLAPPDLAPKASTLIPRGQAVATLVPLHAREVHWDWESNPIAADMDYQGFAVTGHQNGEVHLWDAVKGTHLGQRTALGAPVRAVAISGGWILLGIRPRSAGGPPLYVLAARDGMPKLLPWAVPAIAPGVFRAGWEEGQFFWWESDSVLVEYQARTGAVRRFGGCDKKAGHPFLVDRERRRIYWKNTGGNVTEFDLAERALLPLGDLRWRVLEARRYQAVDPAGLVLVTDARGEDWADVSWLKNMPDGRGPRNSIGGCSQPQAVAASVNRIISTNSNSLWFWTLAEGKLLRAHRCPDQQVLRIESGYVARDDAPNALHFTFRRQGPMVLHWHTGIQESIKSGVYLDRPPLSDPYLCFSPAGYKEVFRPSQDPGLEVNGRKRELRLGKLTVVLGGNRRLDFLRGKEPFAQFWFRVSKNTSWVFASRGFAAGSALEDMAVAWGPAPEREDWRLARLLLREARDDA